MGFSILDMCCKEHLYYVIQIHLKNIIAGSSLLENKKQTEIKTKMKHLKYTFLSNALIVLKGLKKLTNVKLTNLLILLLGWSFFG